jgi:hypothetical protein
MNVKDMFTKQKYTQNNRSVSKYFLIENNNSK